MCLGNGLIRDVFLNVYCKCKVTQALCLRRNILYSCVFGYAKMISKMRRDEETTTTKNCDLRAAALSYPHLKHIVNKR